MISKERVLFCIFRKIVSSKEDEDARNYTTFTKFSVEYHLMCKVYTDVGGIK